MSLFFIINNDALYVAMQVSLFTMIKSVYEGF